MLPRLQARARDRTDSSQMELLSLERIEPWVDLLAERLKCGTAETGRPERSELAALSAVATTDLFAVDFIGENAVVPVLCKDKLELFHGGNWSG